MKRAIFKTLEWILAIGTIIGLLSGVWFAICGEPEIQTADIKTNIGDSTSFHVLENRKNGLRIAYQEQQILTLNQALVSKQLEINSLRNKLASQTKVEIKTQIKNVDVPSIKTFRDTIRIGNELKVFIDSVKFKKTNPWYYIAATSKKDTLNSYSLTIDSLSFVSELVINQSFENKKWFRPATPVVEIYDKNPYAQITALKSIKIQTHVPFYQKRGFVFSIGVGVGIAGFYELVYGFHK